MNQSRPLKLKNKNLKQILTDNFDMLILPSFVIEVCLFAYSKTRIYGIYGIILFFLIIVSTIILYKNHKKKLNKKINELINSKEFKYKISLTQTKEMQGFLFLYKIIDDPYIVFCHNFTVDKYGFCKIPVIYEKYSEPEDKVYLAIKRVVDVFEGKYEKIVDLKTNTVLTSKELEAFLNQEENREKI